MSKLIKTVKLDQLKEGEMIGCEIEGNSIIVACVNGKYYAVDRICTHAGNRLDMGILDGTTLQCPRHRMVYDVTNGKVLRKPGGCGGLGTAANVSDLKIYPAKVMDDFVFVEI